MDTAPERTLTEPSRLATAFARLLRGAGLEVPTSAVLTFAEALAVVGLGRRHDVYWAGRATLLRRPEDRELYDRAFAAFFDQAPYIGSITKPEVVTITLAMDDDSDDGADDGDGQGDDDPTITVRFSAAEVLRSKDFAELDEHELDEARRMMDGLRLAGSRRRSRRLVNDPRRGARPDLRRTVRAALRAGGEPIDRRFRSPSTKPRRLVLLLDVSGSMEPYARALARFAHAAVVGRRRVEVFALGTRLTRITRELSSRDPDRALSAAATRVLDWAGGTRLGDGLRCFNDEWGQRGMARGATVVILSDGWDRGEPEVMAEQMQRLARVAHSVVWVNPLKATAGYAPLARGMAAALPYIDHFVEGHSLEAVQRLATVISES